MANIVGKILKKFGGIICTNTQLVMSYVPPDIFPGSIQETSPFILLPSPLSQQWRCAVHASGWASMAKTAHFRGGQMLGRDAGKGGEEVQTVAPRRSHIPDLNLGNIAQK